MRDLYNAHTDVLPPFWGTKLMTPAFYKEEKFKKFLRQWERKLELEFVKMRHSLLGSNITKQDRKHMKDEIDATISNIY